MTGPGLMTALRRERRFLLCAMQRMSQKHCENMTRKHGGASGLHSIPGLSGITPTRNEPRKPRLPSWNRWQGATWWLSDENCDLWTDDYFIVGQWSCHDLSLVIEGSAPKRTYGAFR